MSGFRIARIFGIPIVIHFTWFIIFGLLVYSLSTNYFPTAYPDLPTQSHIAEGIVSALLLFVSVLIHELGHSLIALRNGVQIVSITLFIFGGLAQLKEDPREPRVEFRIAIAGPITSFLLAGLFYLLAQSGLGGAATVAVTSYLALVNLMLAVFNVVPAFPLDGGRVLRSMLWKRMSKVKATQAAAAVGNFFALLLIFNGILALLGGSGVSGLWSILIGLFLREAATGTSRQTELDEVFSKVQVHDVMVTDCKTLPPHISVEDAVQEHFLRYGFGGFPVEVDGVIRGLLSLSEVRKVPPGERDRTSVQAVMIPLDDRTTISADADIIASLKKMAESGLGRLVAVDETGRCVGLITHNGILRRLQIQKEIGG